jgi:hypothetical protein
MKDLKQLGQTDYLNEASSLERGGGQPHITSKTQGMQTGADKASPAEEAAIEPAIMTGWDKERVQSLSMAPTG